MTIAVSLAQDMEERDGLTSKIRQLPPLGGLRCAVSKFGPWRIDTHGAFAAEKILRHNTPTG